MLGALMKRRLWKTAATIGVGLLTNPTARRVAMNVARKVASKVADVVKKRGAAPRAASGRTS